MGDTLRDTAAPSCIRHCWAPGLDKKCRKANRSLLNDNVLSTDNSRKGLRVTFKLSLRPSLIGTGEHEAVLPDRSGTKSAVVAGVNKVRAPKLTAAYHFLLHYHSTISKLWLRDDPQNRNVLC